MTSDQIRELAEKIFDWSPGIKLDQGPLVQQIEALKLSNEGD